MIVKNFFHYRRDMALGSAQYFHKILNNRFRNKQLSNDQREKGFTEIQFDHMPIKQTRIVEAPKYEHKRTWDGKEECQIHINNVAIVSERIFATFRLVQSKICKFQEGIFSTSGLGSH